MVRGCLEDHNQLGVVSDELGCLDLAGKLPLPLIDKLVSQTASGREEVGLVDWHVLYEGVMLLRTISIRQTSLLSFCMLW